MCRWLAYSGLPVHPADLVLHPKHSLVAQSLDSPLRPRPPSTVTGSGCAGTYPERADLAEFGPNGRVIVSEPLTDLPGAFHEVPESTMAVLAPGVFEHRPFLPVPPS